MEPFIGEIIMFGGNFAPRGWAFCNGQLLAINQNQALFSLLGTTYGGDGRTTFGLPDLRGRVAMHAGNGPGLTPRPLGQKSGQENVTLNTTQIPSHNHTLTGSTARVQVGTEGKGSAPTETAQDNYIGNVTDGFRPNGSGANLNANSLTGNTGNNGGSQSHNNLQPYQCVHYIIALTGIFPSRS